MHEYDNLTYGKTHFMLAGCCLGRLLLLKDVFSRQKVKTVKWKVYLIFSIHPPVHVPEEKFSRIESIIKGSVGCAFKVDVIIFQGF